MNDPNVQAASDYLRKIADFTKGRYLAEYARDQAQAEERAQRLRAEQAERSLSIIRSSRLWPLVTSLYRLKHAAWNQPMASLKTYRRKQGKRDKRGNNG